MSIPQPTACVPAVSLLLAGGITLASFFSFETDFSAERGPDQCCPLLLCFPAQPQPGRPRHTGIKSPGLSSEVRTARSGDLCLHSSLLDSRGCCLLPQREKESLPTSQEGAALGEATSSPNLSFPSVKWTQLSLPHSLAGRKVYLTPLPSACSETSFLSLFVCKHLPLETGLNEPLVLVLSLSPAVLKPHRPAQGRQLHGIQAIVMPGRPCGSVVALT